MHPVLARETHEVLQGENKRRIDKTVDHQPVLGRINIRDPGMVTLEAETVRRDDAVKLVQRREVHRGDRIGSQPFHAAAFDMRLILGGNAVRARVNAFAQHDRPVLKLGYRRISGSACLGSNGCATCCDGTREKATA